MMPPTPKPESAALKNSGPPWNASRISTGVSRRLQADGNGSFRADGLVTGGPYSISANAAGFEGQEVQDVFINLQGNSAVSFALSTGAGEIVVTAARANVTTLATGPGQSFGALVMGLAAGVVCALAVGLKYRLGFDDSLDVVGVHMVGGIVGTIGIGLLGTAVAPSGVDGLFYGGGVHQLGR